MAPRPLFPFPFSQDLQSRAHPETCQPSVVPRHAGVTIVNSSHLQQLLGNRGGHDTCTTGGRDQTHPDGSTLASNLARHGVWSTDLVTPEPSPHRDDGELSQDDGATDGCGHLLGALHTKPNMAVVVSNSYESLEPGPLASPGLFLNRHYLQNLVLQSGSDEHVDDLMLFNWK